MPTLRSASRQLPEAIRRDRNPLFGRQTYSPFILLAQLVEQERIELSAPALQMLVASLGTCCPAIPFLYPP